ncbi:MAG: DNA-binding protein [Opitutales bacterium]|nr:DNA-binding protein [Opitutales bacterium]
MGWTDWTPLPLATPFTQEALRETLDGGQAFRWQFLEMESCWQGIWGRFVARVVLDQDERLLYRIPEELMPQAAEALKNYFLSDTNWGKIADRLPWRSDRELAQAIEAYSGLRLLNQPFPETLLGFLCSATKQIPQIKLLCHKLADSLGEEILPGGPLALPTWEKLAQTSEASLRSLGLGFRAKNIKKTADAIAKDPAVLLRIEHLPYHEAHAALLDFPGVGSKVADCALLFGARMYEAFPVDTWILKVLEKRYGLNDWKKVQLEAFGRIHFGPYAGYAQQYLFARERSLS